MLLCIIIIFYDMIFMFYCFKDPQHVLWFEDPEHVRWFEHQVEFVALPCNET